MMRCPRCDALVGDDKSRCSFCGQDLSVIHYIRRISNTYYNMALEKAQIRDLSGAIVALKQSLEYDKLNKNARNLLGLIYYEMGETVAALSEWVLSKYLCEDDNDADYYISTIQQNQTTLDAINQTIKKYNAALEAAQAGNEDLAIIQLKKVCSLNPHFIRAAQLLALLYMMSADYPKAMKCLERVGRIDRGNTTTLRYISTIEQLSGSTDSSDRVKKASKKDPLANVTPVGTYKEEKRSLMPFVYVIIGLIVGMAVCFVLIRPTLLKSGQTDGTDMADADSRIKVLESKVTGVESERDSLKDEVTKLQKQISKDDSKAKEKSKKYETLIKGTKLYIDGDHISAAQAVAEFSKDDFKDKNAKALYELISVLSDQEIATLIAQARRTINTSYDEAITQLKKIVSIAPKNQEALYLMGRCYHYKRKYKTAKKWYEKAIDVQAGTNFAAQSETYLREVERLLGQD